MRKKHKIKFRDRLRYAKTWISNPTALLVLPTFMLILSVLLALAAPCGRYSSPIHGHCMNGDALVSPEKAAILGLILSVIFSIFIAFSTPAPDWNWSLIFRSMLSIRPDPKTPKWHRVWSIRLFTVAYILCAIIVYLDAPYAGLPWYDNLGQYLILAPFTAWVAAQSLLKLGGHLYLHKQ